MLKNKLNDDLSPRIQQHITARFSDEQVLSWSQQLRREGIVILPELLPQSVHQSLYTAVIDALAVSSEDGRDGDREGQDADAERSAKRVRELPIVRALYECQPLFTFVQRITGVRLSPRQSGSGSIVVSHDEQPGDHTDWHWRSSSFELTFMLKAPSTNDGGMVQCVPHTHRDRGDERIYENLIANQIRTDAVGTGETCLVKADTTLHRTVPLSGASTRIALGLNWDRQHGLHVGFDSVASSFMATHQRSAYPGSKGAGTDQFE